MSQTSKQRRDRKRKKHKKDTGHRQQAQDLLRRSAKRGEWCIVREDYKDGARWHRYGLKEIATEQTCPHCGEADLTIFQVEDGLKDAGTHIQECMACYRWEKIMTNRMQTND